MSLRANNVPYDIIEYEEEEMLDVTNLESGDNVDFALDNEERLIDEDIRDADPSDPDFKNYKSSGSFKNQVSFYDLYKSPYYSHFFR